MKSYSAPNTTMIQSGQRHRQFPIPSFLKTSSSLSFPSNQFTFSLPTPASTSTSMIHHSHHSHHSTINSNKLIQTTPHGFCSDHKKTRVEQYDQSDFDQEQEDGIEERQAKRRKSVAGTIFDSALELALLTSAIGYAAFQLWKGNQINPSSSQTRLSFTPILPSSPPPPYSSSQSLLIPSETSSQPSQRPRLISNRSSNQRKLTHPHLPRSRNPRSNSTTPINSIKTITESFHQQFNLHQEEEEDLMGDFNPSIHHYIPPPTPLIEEESIESELNEDEDSEILEFKNKIQSLIKSGHAALVSKPPNLMDHQPIGPSSSSSSHHHHHHHHDSNRLDDQFNLFHHSNQSNQISVLEQALDQTLKQTRKSWWET